MLRPNRLASYALLFLTGIGVAGCSPKPVIVGSAPQSQNLIFIAQAYRDAAGGPLGRPPKNMEELKPFLDDIAKVNQRSADEFLVSPNDGLPYAIVWGHTGRGPIVYEQKGKDGKHMAVGANLMPYEMSDEGFSRLKPPDGVKQEPAK
jgi:hypothetical protein